MASPNHSPGALPERFEEVIGAAVRACAPASEVVTVTCDEAPCFAALRPATAALDVVTDLVLCDPWRVPYGSRAKRLDAVVHCPGGEESVVLIAPGSALMRRAADPPELADRLSYRWTRALADWSCATDADAVEPERPHAAAPR